MLSLRSMPAPLPLLLSPRAPRAPTPSGSSRSRGPCTCGCSCRGLHTEGDTAFVEFLSDEIKEEKKIEKHKSLPKMSGGWDLEVHGTEDKSVRNVGGEKITVTFNINSSIPPNLIWRRSPPKGRMLKQEPELTSIPNSMVEVIKNGGKKALVLDCHYPEDEVGQQEDESDIFSIKEVSFQSTGESEWNDANEPITHSTQIPWIGPYMNFLPDGRK